MHRALVQPLDERQRVGERRVLGQPLQVGAEARLAARLELVADVDLGGRVVADQHDAEAGRPAMAARERGNLRLDLLLHPDGQRLAIEHPCCHHNRLWLRGVVRRDQAGR